MAARPSCPEPAHLEQLLLGQLDEAETDALEEHLAACIRCAETLRQLAAVDPLVAAMKAPPPALAREDRGLVEALIGQLKVLRVSPVCRERRWDALTPPGPLDTDTGLPQRSNRMPAVYSFLELPQQPDEIGRLGPFRVLGVVGRGGMGVVFRAEDQRVGRPVALKVLLDARCTEPQYQARFQAEASAVARLRHPNIVQLHEAGEHAGRPYLVLEYVVGGNLAEYLARRPQPARASAELTATLAEAVHHFHQCGIVHRDLKPANVLLEVHGPASAPLSAPRITDFGLARCLDAEGLTQTGDLLGTPGYMAPELTRGRGPENASGPAADVYGLGAILYELLTGRPPFQGETVADTLEQVRTLDPVSVCRLQPKIPRDLDTICLKCLEKEPSRRYGSARALAEDLGRFLRGEPIQARPVSRWERLGKWARRRPGLTALAVACGMLLALLISGGVAYQVRLQAAVQRAEAKELATRRQYQQAHATLDQMLSRLEDRQLANVPRLKELQRGLLEDALAFYQRALDQAESPDSDMRRDAAVAFQRAADIERILGRNESAAEKYRRAVELIEGLPVEERGDRNTQMLRAYGYLGLAGVASMTRRHAEADQHNRKALEILEQLSREQPNDLAVLNELAGAEHNQGSYNRDSKPGEAEAHYTRAMAIRTILVRDHPQVEAYQAALAEDYQDLAQVYRQTDRETEAAQVFARAESLLRPLVDRHPEEEKYALSLVALYVNWGYLLAGTGQPQVAMERLDLAVRLAEAVLLKEPGEALALDRALTVHGARAEIAEFLGRFGNSVKDWDRVIQLAHPSQQLPWRLQRARVLTRAGDHARATVEAGELAARPEATNDNLYFLAGVYAFAIKPVHEDTRLSPTERARLIERYAAQAIGLLRKLQNRNYFKDANHARTLRTDPGLEPLRDREDFQQLLTAIGNP